MLANEVSLYRGSFPYILLYCDRGSTLPDSLRVATEWLSVRLLSSMTGQFFSGNERDVKAFLQAKGTLYLIFVSVIPVYVTEQI